MKILVRQFLLLIFLGIFAVACNSLKQSEKRLLSGDYDTAITQSLRYIRNKPNGQKTSEFFRIMQTAYEKANQRDKDKILFLLKDKNPENLKELYSLYKRLENRQNRIKPVVNSTNKARFPMVDYSADIIKMKKELSYHLYEKSISIMENGHRVEDFRKAYDNFHYINKINKGYKDVESKMEEAHLKGTNFVLVKISNKSDKILPRRLEKDLLNFDTYKINDFWTVYHSQSDRNIDYDYEMLLDITNIEVSPERISEREIMKEKQIQDGYVELLDDAGNIVTDSLGNKIEVENFITVSCHLLEVSQEKKASVGGQVFFNDLRSGQQIAHYPLRSDFVFSHHYANANGDTRALDEAFIGMTRLARVPFPSDKQMIYDTGKDLKEKLSKIIRNQRF